MRIGVPREITGAIRHTSTFALNDATLRFVLALADKDHARASADDARLRSGLDVAFGKVTCRPDAEALGYDCVSPSTALQ